MTDEGFATANDQNQNEQSNQTHEGATGGSGDGTGAQVTYYTSAELEATHPKDWDVERIDPAIRPTVEKALNEAKELKAAHTRVSQELAELRKPKDDEVYFPDQKMDTVFKEYLKTPSQIIGEINAEILRLRNIPADHDDYFTAQAHIEHWKGVKESFQEKRMEVMERRKEAEVLAASVKSELGENYKELKEYAVSVGFTASQFEKQPALREAVRGMWTVANAGKTAGKKEVKPTPNKGVSTPSGIGGGGSVEPGGFDPFDPKVSDTERISYWRSQKGR